MHNFQNTSYIFGFKPPILNEDVNLVNGGRDVNEVVSKDVGENGAEYGSKVSDDEEKGGDDHGMK